MIGKSQIKFTPNETLQELNSGESQAVTFTYTVENAQGATDTAKVTLKCSWQ